MPVFSSLLDRIAAAVTDRIINGRVSGDTHDRVLLTPAGLRIGDGATEALTGVTQANFWGRRPVGAGNIIVLGRSGDGLKNLVEVQDFASAPIAATNEAGAAFWGNDHICNQYGVFYPKATDLTIYGSMVIGGISWATHIGPPGNIMTWNDSLAEQYDGARAQSMGAWTTLVNCTSSVDSSFSGASSPPNPTGLRSCHRFTASSAATMSWSIPAASAYAIRAGTRTDMMIGVRSAVTGRSMTLGMVWFNAAGTQVGSTILGPAQTSTTSGWTFLRVSGMPPSNATKVSPIVTVTSPANAEVHYSVACGIWLGLVPGDLTAWSPPYVYNQAGTGADIGSLYFRADGYKNPTQRMYTCVTAGAPAVARWSNDTTPYASPARMSMFGHLASQVGFAGTATGSTPTDWQVFEILAGMMRIDEEDMRSEMVAGAKLCTEGFAQGGQSTVVQWMRKTQSRLKPYISKDGVTVFCYGLYDLAAVTSGQGAAVVAHFNGAGSTSANGAIVNTLRDFICRARASVILEAPAGTGTAPWTVLTMNAPSTADYASGSSRPGLTTPDGAFRQMVTVTTHTFTFTIPAAIQDGSEIDFSFVGAVGAFGGTITWTGTAATTGALFSSGITTQISNVIDSGFGHGRFVKRFTGLNSAHAGQTIIGTLSQVDASGAVNLDCVYIAGPRPGAVVVCNQYRLLAAGYTSFAGSYWAGQTEATCDATVATLNTSLAGLVAEFTGGEVGLADLDTALNKQADFFAADGVNINEDGSMAIAQIISRTVADIQSVVDTRQVVMDRHDKRSQSICQWIIPEGTAGGLTATTSTKRWVSDDYYKITGYRAALAVAGSTASTFDLLLGINGATPTTTYPTNPGNRCTIAISAITGASLAPPDMPYVAPGDIIAIQCTAAGTSATNSMITVYAKKISPP